MIAKLATKTNVVETILTKEENKQLNSDNMIVIDENMDEEELVAQINKGIKSVNTILKAIFLDNEVMLEEVYNLVSDNYNKLTPRKRMGIFANINGMVSEVFDIVRPEIAVIDSTVEGFSIFFENEKLYMYNGLFNSKNSGLTILIKYIAELRKYLCMGLTNAAYINDIPREKLTGHARVYYDNLTDSLLLNLWSNLKKREDKDYPYQPLVVDANILSMQILKQLLKKVYKKTKKIDKEMSNLAYDLMNFEANYDYLLKQRKRVEEENKKNIQSCKSEYVNYNRYLKTISQDLSKFSDEEFFELFNFNYWPALNEDPNEQLARILTNMANELMHRVFANFDTSNIEFPIYNLTYNEEENSMLFSCDFNGMHNEDFVNSSSEVFYSVASDISKMCQIYNLIEFNNEQEREEYFSMKEWCDLKNHDYSDESDYEIVHDGLNIILRKVNEFLAKIKKKIDEAISKSKFTPHGASMIKCEDKNAYYDFHEFKNGRTREEIEKILAEYIKEDVIEMKRRNSGGGR